MCASARGRERSLAHIIASDGFEPGDELLDKQRLGKIVSQAADYTPDLVPVEPGEEMPSRSVSVLAAFANGGSGRWAATRCLIWLSRLRRTRL